jgi:hypothetical protein
MRCVVVNAPSDALSGLYCIDVGYFMQDHYHQEGAVNVTAGSRRRPMSNKLKIAVKELHECLHHAASPAVMVIALRFLIRIALHASLERRIDFHMLSLQKPFGEAVSLDFKVVNPVSVSGHKGFYLFSERGAQDYCLLYECIKPT